MIIEEVLRRIITINKQIQMTEKIKGERDRQEYIRMCNENSAKEIQNEKNFKQKFIDFDQKQTQINNKFQQTVLKDYSRRNKHKDAITNNKPAYYDRIEGEYYNYLTDKSNRMRSAWQFQKDKIEQKYNEVSRIPEMKTKMGDSSYKKFQEYQEEQKKMRLDNKNMQTQYAGLLKTQVDIKKDSKKVSEADKPNNIFIGKYKLHRNSSLPMIPGIHSNSSLTGVGDLDSFTNKFKGSRVPQEALEENRRTRNLLNSYKTSIPNAKLGKSALKNSRNTLRKSGLSTLGSTGNNRYSTFDGNSLHKVNTKTTSVNQYPPGQNFNRSNVEGHINHRVTDTFRSTLEL
mmetsp:Transcript_12264/g.12300  ORF Transcript_12264/g.12300 Transcript_12264/m.12300 type:complete len:344 (-) Transcript_12264:22-1053(-)